jgi:hypothetical protein
LVKQRYRRKFVMQKIASQIADRVLVKMAEEDELTPDQLKNLAMFLGPIGGAAVAPEGAGARTFGHMAGKGLAGQLAGTAAGGGVGAGLGALGALLSRGRITPRQGAVMGGIGGGMLGGLTGQALGSRSGFESGSGLGGTE